MNRAFAALFAATCLWVSGADCSGSEDTRISSVHTNWVDRWVTNTTDIYMQVNRFVNEYHTNRVLAVRTNYINLFTTNIVSKSLTNTVFVESLRTNFVQAYRTNLQTLHLTNWTTVLAFKTNWVTKPITNLVEIEMSREASPGAAVNFPTKDALNSEPLSLQAARNARLMNKNQVEVQLSVSWRQGVSAPVQVQQWRIEREDGSFLCFGQESEFRRALPIGTYKVTVKAQRDAKSPPLSALGTLTVTAREVSLEQRPSRNNSTI